MRKGARFNLEAVQPQIEAAMQANQLTETNPDKALALTREHNRETGPNCPPSPSP
jgi:hypothetical protein